MIPAAASANSATHTLKFISVTKKSIMFTKTSGASQDTDVNAAGKTVGFDMLYYVATSATSGAVNVTVDTTGGFLYGTGTINFKTGAFSKGKVTGGSGCVRWSHRNDQGQGHLQDQDRGHDHLQHVTTAEPGSAAYRRARYRLTRCRALRHPADMTFSLPCHRSGSYVVSRI